MITCPSSEILRQGSAAPRPIAPARRPLERATTCDRGASAHSFYLLMPPIPIRALVSLPVEARTIAREDRARATFADRMAATGSRPFTLPIFNRIKLPARITG